MLKIACSDNALFESTNFTFSGLKGQTKVGREGLHYFSKKATIVLTSPNQQFIDKVVIGLFQESHILLGNLMLQADAVEIEEAPIFQESMKYLCISPIVPFHQVEGLNNKLFVNPLSDEFSDMLYDSTMYRMEKSGVYTPEQISSFFRFQVIPDQQYLERINRMDKKFARIYSVIKDGQIMEARGYTLPFEVLAAPEVQEFIYHNGFGELADHGFGMLDIPNFNPIKTPYEVSDSSTQE
ncbi:CRISPR-associated endoribonuclease Cas6 [Flammeovirga yaeyamensis]|uniref:CRISPR-associated endoribonuclease Cas6 n=1 Tax=Flammeovirga yaeyamensis TaxID=367791 RepID=A0AAX1N163_9BACT|nr:MULTISPECIES: CRISPR-associated endoribonuclease Cas6 [Flammeovirga]MBB3698537.1 CRISPR-associated endoribonuclease Cas6 [Flammeovirga yaeyamensis]QWG01101.1 CRISPR-associated endoribonuclease Cas6 [Flammeovirga yaeyamensis]